MILTKNYPAGRNLHNMFNDLFDSFPANYEPRSNSSAPVNIIESESGYNLEFNAPGRDKEDFQLNIDKGLLTVSYEKKNREQKNEEKFIRKEFSYSNFKRSFSVDEKINADGIEAKYENGILKVYLPKKEEVKISPKQISVQ